MVMIVVMIVVVVVVVVMIVVMIIASSMTPFISGAAPRATLSQPLVLCRCHRDL
jgi:hypothetical protein